ncbi:hypothetical protein ABIE78_002878 [Sinorhizobium fredii]|nr:hypothetical protein [Sinorhizobium fredii]
MRAIAEILTYWRQVVFAGMACRFAGLQSLHPALPRLASSVQSEAGKSDGRVTPRKHYNRQS